MADRTATLTAIMHDGVSGPARKITAEITGLGHSTSRLGTVMQGVGQGIGQSVFGLIDRAGSAVVRFGVESVRAAIDQQASLARLDAALRANVANWNGDTRAIEATILAREDLGFTDDDLRSSFTVLVAATHNVDEALRIQNTAMDLARFKHISLQEASDALVKIEGGRYRMLASLGIILEKGATQEQALAAVQKVAAGQAEAYSKTTQGSIDRMNVAIEEFQETVGTALLPAVKDLATGIVTYAIPAARAFLDILGGLGDRLAAVIVKLIEFGKTVIGVVQTVAAPLGNLNDLVGGLGGALGIGQGPRGQQPGPTFAGRAGLGSPGIPAPTLAPRSAAGGSFGGRTTIVNNNFNSAWPPSPVQARQISTYISKVIADEERRYTGAVEHGAGR